MMKGEQPLLFSDDDKNLRDFIYVDDINDFHLMAIEDDRVNNKMFRLGSGKSTSMKEVFETIKKIMASSVEPEIKERPNDPDFKAAETLADISDASALSWTPKTSLEQGLTAMVEYLKGEMAAGKIK